MLNVMLVPCFYIQGLKMKYLLLVLSLFIVGCSTLNPLPTSEPPAKDSSGNRTAPDYQKGGLLQATDIREAKDNVKVYADWYMDRSIELRGYEYNASDTGLAGGVIGILGGLVKSPEAALVGGLLASGASMTSQRYRFLVQAQNYEKASDTLYCMHRNINLMPDDVNISASTMIQINEKIDELRRKLRKNQSDITLSNPDLGDLEARIKQELEAENKFSLVNKGFLAIVATHSKSEVDQAFEKLLVDKLGKCVAAY